MEALKTFGRWFLLVAGLLLSALACVEALRELRGGPKTDELFLLITVFTVSGGIVGGLIALVIRRLILSAFPRGKLLLGQELLECANRLGVSLKHTHDGDSNLLEPDLQRRVLEAEKAIRERRGYVVAVGSAVVAALSAIAAWYVHLK